MIAIVPIQAINPGLRGTLLFELCISMYVMYNTLHTYHTYHTQRCMYTYLLIYKKSKKVKSGLAPSHLKSRFVVIVIKVLALLFFFFFFWEGFDKEARNEYYLPVMSNGVCTIRMYHTSYPYIGMIEARSQAAKSKSAWFFGGRGISLNKVARQHGSTAKGWLHLLIGAKL